jgi:SPX domain protein involved in polyphosphate accumulation
MLSPELSILEVKANEKIPYWITELVASHGIKLIRISKYCQAVEIGALGTKMMLTG